MKIHLALLTGGVVVLVGAAATGAQTRIPPSTLGYPLVWEFKTAPPRATPAPGSACEVADRYVTLIGARRGKDVPELFAEDGELLFQGQVRRGRTEIHGFYDTVNVRGAIPIAFIDRGAECFMEVANLSAGDDIWRLTAVDHFTVTPGRQISRLVIYLQRAAPAAGGPGASPPTQR